MRIPEKLFILCILKLYKYTDIPQYNAIEARSTDKASTSVGWDAMAMEYDCSRRPAFASTDPYNLNA